MQYFTDWLTPYPSKQIFPSSVNPNWCVFTGTRKCLKENSFDFIDKNFAVCNHQSNFEQDHHLMIIGDIYLTNRKQLLSRLSSK